MYILSGSGWRILQGLTGIRRTMDISQGRVCLGKKTFEMEVAATGAALPHKLLTLPTYTHIHSGIYAKIYFLSAMVIWLYGAIGFGAKKGVSGVEWVTPFKIEDKTTKHMRL